MPRQSSDAIDQFSLIPPNRNPRSPCHRAWPRWLSEDACCQGEFIEIDPLNQGANLVRGMRNARLVQPTHREPDGLGIPKLMQAPPCKKPKWLVRISQPLHQLDRWYSRRGQPLEARRDHSRILIVQPGFGRNTGAL
jgi:hypothetical protein